MIHDARMKAKEILIKNWNTGNTGEKLKQKWDGKKKNVGLVVTCKHNCIIHRMVNSSAMDSDDDNVHGHIHDMIITVRVLTK